MAAVWLHPHLLATWVAASLTAMFERSHYTQHHHPLRAWLQVSLPMLAPLLLGGGMLLRSIKSNASFLFPRIGLLVVLLWLLWFANSVLQNTTAYLRKQVRLLVPWGGCAPYDGPPEGGLPRGRLVGLMGVRQTAHWVNGPTQRASPESTHPTP